MVERLRKCRQHTPGLDIHGDNGLGGGLGLALLLLAVLSQTLLTDTDSLSILLLVIATEQVDIIVILSSGGVGGLGGVQGNLSDLGAVSGVGQAGIARQSGELILVRGNVLVPTSGVRSLGGVGSLLEGLEDSNIGLRGVVSEKWGEGLVRGGLFFFLHDKEGWPKKIEGEERDINSHGGGGDTGRESPMETVCKLIASQFRYQ